MEDDRRLQSNQERSMKMSDSLYMSGLKVNSYVLAEGEGGLILLQRMLQRDGSELWGIMRDGICLTKTKKKKAVWMYGRTPSNRSDSFLKKSRFDLSSAIEIWRSYVDYKRKDEFRDELMKRYSYVQDFCEDFKIVENFSRKKKIFNRFEI